MLVLNHAWIQAWLNAEIPDAEQVETFLLKQGFEVEPVEPIYTKDIVIGQITQIDKHPNADKLNLCQVQLGNQRSETIVCGCPSVAVGIKVAVALNGTDLGDFVIEKRKIRGVESNGMLCSMKELGFKVASTGIWHLHAQAPVGQMLDTWLQRSHRRYGIELTPNRGDCMSVKGMAREFAIGVDCQAQAPWGQAAPSFMQLPLQASVAVSDEASAFVEAMYLVRLKRPAGPLAQTPDWMKARLVESGFSLHHIVVDTLNYVMLETGQPMHAYTGHLGDNFSLTTGIKGCLAMLNGEEAALDARSLMIMNQDKPVCIAGYMGSQASASSEEDEAIVLEAAYFAAEKVAFHCRQYPWHTQSGSRFERGIDRHNTQYAMQRAIDLLATYAEFSPSYRMAMQAEPAQAATIQLPLDLPEKLLGYAVEPKAIEAALTRVGCEVSLADGGFEVGVPSWRNDLQLPESLVGEILRIHGYPEHHAGRLHATFSAGVETYTQIDRAMDQYKQHMLGQGFYETYSYSFEDRQETLDFHEDEASVVSLRNPISAAFGAMRVSMFPGLFKQVKRNLAKQISDVRLFELGRCFQSDDQGKVQEHNQLSAVCCGRMFQENWIAQSNISFFYAKSLLMSVTKVLPVHADSRLTWQSVPVAGMHPHQSGKLMAGDVQVGCCGLLHPQLAKKHKITQDVFFLSVNLDWLIANQAAVAYAAVSNQPAMRRDLSLIVPDVVSYAQIKQEIQASVFQYLTKVVIFDIYRGEQIPHGCYSISIGLLFQGETRTLTDEDLSPMMHALTSNFAEKLNIKTRGGKE